MLPNELRSFSQSLIAVGLFASNVLFWRDQGYFGQAAELTPLLHTWSLAVEEQYYLIFPIFLLMAWRFGRNRIFWAICLIAVISLAASEWGWRNKPNANFYLAPTRAWELLVGSLCAFWLTQRGQGTHEWGALSGLALIAFAVFCFSSETPFPSVYALVPVGGTALIILFGGNGTRVAKLLSTRMLVGIGLISYSAYLWHQPLFAFARIRATLDPSPFLMAGLTVLSLVLGFFSWRFVEMPFRNSRSHILRDRRVVFAASLLFTSLFVSIGLLGHFTRGFEGSFDKRTQLIATAQNDKADPLCHFGEARFIPNHPEPLCVKKFPSSPTVFLLGDSHALAISEALKNKMVARRISYYDMTYSSCVPLLGFKRSNSEGAECQRFNLSVLKYAKTTNVKTLVLTSRFPLYLDGVRYDNGEGGIERGECHAIDLSTQKPSSCNDPQRRFRVLDAYEKRIRELAKSFNVVLVYPIPEAGWDVPKQVFKNTHFNGESELLTTSYQRYKARTLMVRNLFDRLADELPNVYTARIDQALCSERTGRCVNADENGVYYYDDDHLSNAGARLVAPVIVSAIEVASGKAR